MRKKFGVFKEKYAHIISMLEKGYPYTDVILDLKDNHQLDLSFNTFRSYLYRYRKELNLDLNTSTRSTAPNVDSRNYPTDAPVSNIENATESINTDDEKERPQQVFRNRASGEAFIQKLLNGS